MIDRTIEILRSLVEVPSVSADSNRVISSRVAEFLRSAGFDLEEQAYRDRRGIEKVNLIGTRGSGSSGFLYCAHTDVVPVDNWTYTHSAAFEPSQRDNRIYGRGSCDMKGSLACFIAVAEFYKDHALESPLSVICTADEEVGFIGAKHVVEESQKFRLMLEQQPLTVIGEPTTLQVVHAHKGSCLIRAISHGRAGHSSGTYGINANLKMIPFLNELHDIYHETQTASEWLDSRFDPPTISLNLGINDFTYATNITPERSVCTVYFRPMPDQPVDSLVNRIAEKAAQCELEFRVEVNSGPVFTPADSPHIQGMLEITGESEAKTVCYGTDAAMLTSLKQIVICGPGSIEQAHTEDEWISIEQLEKGTDLYRNLIQKHCL